MFTGGSNFHSIVVYIYTKRQAVLNIVYIFGSKCEHQGDMDGRKSDVPSDILFSPGGANSPFTHEKRD